jgi:hypothetical protein
MERTTEGKYLLQTVDSASRETKKEWNKKKSGKAQGSREYKIG